MRFTDEQLEQWMREAYASEGRPVQTGPSQRKFGQLRQQLFHDRCDRENRCHTHPDTHMQYVLDEEHCPKCVASWGKTMQQMHSEIMGRHING